MEFSVAPVSEIIETDEYIWLKCCETVVRITAQFLCNPCLTQENKDYINQGHCYCLMIKALLWVFPCSWRLVDQSIAVITINEWLISDWYSLPTPWYIFLFCYDLRIFYMFVHSLCCCSSDFFLSWTYLLFGFFKYSKITDFFGKPTMSSHHLHLHMLFITVYHVVKMHKFWEIEFKFLVASLGNVLIC